MSGSGGTVSHPPSDTAMSASLSFKEAVLLALDGNLRNGSPSDDFEPSWPEAVACVLVLLVSERLLCVITAYLETKVRLADFLTDASLEFKLTYNSC